jgi:hypothetical protein
MSRPRPDSQEPDTRPLTLRNIYVHPPTKAGLYEAMFRWARRWQHSPDEVYGPLEVEAGEYVAANARRLFARAFIEHCPTKYAAAVKFR